MKKIVCVKEGDFKPNIFNDLMETVNMRQDKTDYPQQAGFYTRMDFSFRVGRNRTEKNPQSPFALFHFSVNPTEAEQQSETFRPIDTNKMMDILDSGYDFVLFGFYSDSHLVTDYNLIQNAKYIVRDEQERLINYDTKDLIIEDVNGKITFITTLFGMIKVGSLPAYYLILDPNLVHTSDGFDYDDPVSDTKYHLDCDATIKEMFFAPAFNEGVTKINPNILLTSLDSFTIDIFGNSLFKQYIGTEETSVMNVTVDSNLTVTQNGNKLLVDVNKPIGYIKYTVNAGKFFNLIQSAEKLEFEFVVLKS